MSWLDSFSSTKHLFAGCDARREAEKRVWYGKKMAAICVRNLSDGDLLEALDGLADKHRELVARMVEHLAEVERRRLYLGMGYSSMYAYATGRLGLSEHEAYLRIAAARAAVHDDGILAGPESGELSLSTVKLVAPHLRTNPELLPAAAGMSKRAVERLVAETTGTRSPRTELRMRAVSGGQVELSCVVSQEVAELLEHALDASMHENPARNPGHVLEQALGLYLAKKNRPRGRVPADAERKIEGPKACAFVGDDGTECGEKRFLQIDHIVPKAKGGTDDPDNLRWMCGAHNRFEAERQLGPGRVAAKRRAAHAARTGAETSPARKPSREVEEANPDSETRSEIQAQVKSALVNMGFRELEAARAAHEACVGNHPQPGDRALRRASRPEPCDLARKGADATLRPRAAYSPKPEVGGAALSLGARSEIGLA